MLAAMKAMESATLLLPKAITEYIGRKTLARGVLEKEKVRGRGRPRAGEEERAARRDQEPRRRRRA